MKYKLIMMFLIIAKWAFCQSDTSVHLLEIIKDSTSSLSVSKNDSFYYTYYFNGVKNLRVIEKSGKYYAYTYYENGKLKSECPVKLVVSGECTIYSAHEVCKNYFDVWRNGEYKEYYENGVLKEKGKYKGGMKDGVWNYYDTNGRRTEVKKWMMSVDGNNIEHHYIGCLSGY